ncbi:hypothetical protein RCG23_01580 [Neobacillus sp. PS3-34]|uniref:hypothetical protein n=1 Tax=Neobacillus sp. PS3-34 TaxID=3070678 RepID=UPI0027E06037|nr:hypothetical protein [Neobacillus sp. PS3-34]WML48849.1 hypothetical protein RCG23_01580 [Neobacillus sp. PS3-34]
MTRLELYHDRPKQFHLKGLFFFILSCAILIGGFVWLNRYSQSTIRIDAPKEDLGRKVVVHLPNGREVFTYEKFIIEKAGKTFYKGERNTIDLTGGTLDYKNWE